MAQPSPIHSWKLMGPSVVSAVKSGAVSLMRKDTVIPPVCAAASCWRYGQKILRRALRTLSNAGF
jgi:hypothetical protein